MALLASQQTKVTGTVLAFTAANASETFRPSDRGRLIVLTGSTTTNAVVVVPGLDERGQPKGDITVACGTNARTTIGPLGMDFADPAGSNLGTVTFSGARTNVEVAWELI